MDVITGYGDALFDRVLWFPFPMVVDCFLRPEARLPVPEMGDAGGSPVATAAGGCSCCSGAEGMTLAFDLGRLEVLPAGTTSRESIF